MRHLSRKLNLRTVFKEIKDEKKTLSFSILRKKKSMKVGNSRRRFTFLIVEGVKKITE